MNRLRKRSWMKVWLVISPIQWSYSAGVGSSPWSSK